MEGTQSESQGLILNYTASVSSYQEKKLPSLQYPCLTKLWSWQSKWLDKETFATWIVPERIFMQIENRTGVLCSLIFISVFLLLLLTREGSAKWSPKKVSHGKHLVKDLCVQMPWLHATNSIVPCFTRLPGRTSQGNLTQGNSTKGWINKKPKYESH